MRTITRQQFASAIEAGLASAKRMPAPMKDDLRALARTHVGPVAVGSFECDGVGCPLTLCYLNGERALASQYAFYRGFDAYFIEHGLAPEGGGSGLVEVVA